MGGIFQHLFLKIFSKLVYFDGMHPSYSLKLVNVLNLHILYYILMAKLIILRAHTDF